MTFEAGEQTVFANPLYEPYPVYLQAVNRSPRAAYLFINQPDLPFENSMRLMGASYISGGIPDVGKYIMVWPKSSRRGKGSPPGDRRCPRSRDLGVHPGPGAGYTPGELRCDWPAHPLERVRQGIVWEGSSEGKTWHRLMTSRDLFLLPLDWVIGQPRFDQGEALPVFQPPRDAPSVPEADPRRGKPWTFSAGSGCRWRPMPGSRDSRLHDTPRIRDRIRFGR